MVMTDLFCSAAENNVIELPGSLARTQLHVRYKPGTDDVEVGPASLCRKQPCCCTASCHTLQHKAGVLEADV